MLRGICVAVALCAAGPASAAIVTVTLTGTIAAKGSSSLTTTSESPLKVGDTVNATIRFNDAFEWSPEQERDPHLSLLVEAGPFSWREHNTFNWNDLDFYYAYADGNFGGMIFEADNDPGDTHPDIKLTGFAFALGDFGYLLYEGPTFQGSFDQSSVGITTAPLPEPSTWAMMLLGFGGVGTAIRRYKPGRRLAA